MADDDLDLGPSRRLMSHERLELVATIVMSVAVVLTAWSAFQAGKVERPAIDQVRQGRSSAGLDCGDRSTGNAPVTLVGFSEPHRMMPRELRGEWTGGNGVHGKVVTATNQLPSAATSRVACGTGFVLECVDRISGAPVGRSSGARPPL